MTANKTKNAETIATISKLIIGNGFKVDRYGNYKKIIEGDEYRYKFNPTSYRFEKKVMGGWMRIRSMYYKDYRKISGGK